VNPQAVLQERYPQYDFALYFDLLKHFRRTPKIGVTQEHHILPRKQFSKFKDFKQYPENRIVLAVQEHVQVHVLLEALTCGVIWKTPPQWIASAGSEKHRSALNRPEVKARLSAAARKRYENPEERAKQSVRQAAAMKRYFEDPEAHSRLKAGWTPEATARRVASYKATCIRRKTERNA